METYEFLTFLVVFTVLIIYKTIKEKPPPCAPNLGGEISHT